MNPPAASLRRITRDDCQSGDWVESALVPEWAGLEGRQTFTPVAVSISPEEGRLGGVLAAPASRSWEFEARTEGDQRYWIRIT
jgi:hypothetical protein